MGKCYCPACGYKHDLYVHDSVMATTRICPIKRIVLSIALKGKVQKIKIKGTFKI